MNPHPFISRRSGAVLALAVILALPAATFQPDAPDLEASVSGEGELQQLVGECTTGVASGQATPDGRPLLWKNRDIYGGQEYHYIDARIPFIALTYNNPGDYGSRYYAGMNAAGFAIENSDAHNFNNGPHNDGSTMLEALSTCRTIDDFTALLDSADQVDSAGRYGYNYGVIDAFGGAAMIEADRHGYTRFDAVDSPEGFLIRTNFAFTGGLGRQGVERYERAYQLWKRAMEENRLTAEFIYQQVVRDLAIPGCDPYPLPFDGYCEYFGVRYPYGCIPNDDAVLRSTTRSVMVAHGVPAGGRPDGAVIWAMVGTPLGGVATPLWVRAGSVPPQYNGAAASPLCIRADALALWSYDYTNYRTSVNTWRLVNPVGTGVWDFTLPLERWVFAKTAAFLGSPNFSYDRLEAFQNEVALQVLDTLYTWQPTYDVTDLAAPVFERGNIQLVWGELDGGQDRRQDGGPHYIVYRSSHPFREGERGQRLAEVGEPRYTDRNPPPRGAYYRVEAFF